MVAHHPEHALLLDFTAGGLAEGPSLAVAAHVALCRQCTQVVARLEALGGALLETIEPVAMSSDGLDLCLDRIAAGDRPVRHVAGAPVHLHVGAVLPFPLSRYVDGAAKWRVSWGVEEIPIGLGGSSHRASMLRIRAGRAMPRHTHIGTEFTLVLAGGFTDGQRHYGPGDLAVASVERHAPVADAEGMCVCLTVLEAPVRLVGPLARLLNPLLRWRDRNLHRASA